MARPTARRRPTSSSRPAAASPRTDRAATPDAAGTGRLHRFRRRAAAAAGPSLVGVIAAVGLQLTVSPADTSLVEAALYGLVLGTGFQAWDRLRSRLGGATALAAICLGCATVFGLAGAAAAALGGVCDGCVGGPTVGFMILLGVAVPLTVAVTVGPLIFIARRVPRWVAELRARLQA